MARRWPDVVRAAVERAGGSVDRSADGHLKVYDRAGRFVVKVRVGGHGHDVNGTSRSVLRGLVRRIESSGEVLDLAAVERDQEEVG